jgi:4,5-DOPA dioxygenase extradiol
LNSINLLFAAYGSPYIALSEHYQQQYQGIKHLLDKDSLILIISPHWTSENKIYVSNNKTIDNLFDFNGFPKELYDINVKYKGDQAMSNEITKFFRNENFNAILADNHKLDHGAWIPLYLLDLPKKQKVIQISLPKNLDSKEYYKFGKTLKNFHVKRKNKTQHLVYVFTGNIAYNSKLIYFSRIDAPVDSWVIDFDRFVLTSTEERLIERLLNYDKTAFGYRAVEDIHRIAGFFMALGMLDQDSEITWFNQEVIFGNIAMRSFYSTI